MKNLIILDINGLLIDRYHKNDVTNDKYDFITPNNYCIYKRPYLKVFLDKLFLHFIVGFWSSMNVEDTKFILEKILSERQLKELQIVYTKEDCDIKGYFDNGQPIYLKNLKTIWNNPKFTGYDMNTLLIDDTPYKSVLNPNHTSIHVRTYCYLQKYDNGLIDLKNFLSKSLAKNIKTFLKDYSYNKFELFSECDKLNYIKQEDTIHECKDIKKNKLRSKRYMSKIILLFGILQVLSRKKKVKDIKMR